MIPKEIDSLLKNWARWAKESKHSCKRCGSAEGRFKTPATDEELEERKTTALNPLNEASAVAVEKTLAYVPKKTRTVLIAFYIKKAKDKELATLLQTTISNVGYALAHETKIFYNSMQNRYCIVRNKGLYCRYTN
jgi:DNA-directed RNA polymerase specialized sigma24 family protein